ncbi:reverse transcriptase family protein [Ideonella sp. DXS29W]|uniref:RNA-directed DNA polymerase n=1 Tax=Ideonella lacteola TaxID=2984193 RepID=A0ABU9BVC1_9BURK
MTDLRQHTSLSLARAMLSGSARASGLRARIESCLGGPAPWAEVLVQRCSRFSVDRWLRTTPESLAQIIDADEGFDRAWAQRLGLYVRRYFLHWPHLQRPAPCGLHQVPWPEWRHSGALADALRLSTGALWRLTRPAPWQRHLALAEQHYRCHMLPKRTVGWRLLEVPHPYLMALQRRLLHGLIAHLPAHEAACGYTPGRSVVDHARAHTGQAVLLKFDLQDFFSSVRASRVHALFATIGYPEQVARELTALCTTATPEPVLQRLHSEGGLEWTQVQRLREPHLPQGSPTSPALANLCAFRLDLRLDGLAHALGARYTRYADDIVLSGSESLRVSRARIEAWVARIAHEEGFALNLRKSRCVGTADRQQVCGIVVNQHTNLPRPAFDLLKAVLHQCVRDGPHQANREQLPDWRAHLQGRLAWAEQLNPAKAQKLRRLFDQIDWGDAPCAPPVLVATHRGSVV